MRDEATLFLCGSYRGKMRIGQGQCPTCLEIFRCRCAPDCPNITLMIANPMMQEIDGALMPVTELTVFQAEQLAGLLLRLADEIRTTAR